MKRIRINAPGGIEVLQAEESAIPEPKPNQVLVRIKATSLNHLDIWVRKGLPFSPYPLTPGSDGAGVVESTGSQVSSFKKDDRVFISPGFSCGTCRFCLAGNDNLCKDYHIFGESADGFDSEFVAVDEHLVFHLPDSVSFSESAASTLVFLTAWQMVVDKGQIKSGDTVFVWGGSSGVGSAAIQIARYFGAEVIAAASSSEKLAVAEKCGASTLLNYQTDDIVREVKAKTGKRGVDLVIEHTGAETLSRSVQMTAKGGKIVTCGATTGWDAKIDLRHIFFRQISLIGSTMGSRNHLVPIMKLISEGKLKPVIDRELSLWEIQKGHELIESGKTLGKIVLVT